MTVLVDFHCPVHGFLATASPSFDVRCACGRRSARYFGKRKLTAAEVRKLRREARR